MATHLDLEEQEQLDQLKHFWSKWGSLISAFIIFAAGAVAILNGYQYWKDRQAAQAAGLFEAIELAVRADDKSRMIQALVDIREKYAGTHQAAHASLAVAKKMVDSGNADGARDALAWVVANAGDDGLKAIARLRLGGLLLDQKNYDEALKQLSAGAPAEFDGVFADRRGDVLLLQEKRLEAVVEYAKAYKAMDERVDYRRLVEVKLGALGGLPPAESGDNGSSVQGVQ